MDKDEERAEFLAEAERQSKLIADMGDDPDIEAWMEAVAVPLPEEPENWWIRNSGDVSPAENED
jgi:hypothetical protein